MIKYKTQYGEEFEFENVDELLKYLDYKKYDVKMDEDFYPELNMKSKEVIQDDWSEFIREEDDGDFDMERKTDKDVLKEAFDRIGVKYEDHGCYISLDGSNIIGCFDVDFNFDDIDNYKFEQVEVFND